LRETDGKSCVGSSFFVLDGGRPSCQLLTLDKHQNRFSDQNPVVQTERIVLDVSDLPVGHLTGPMDQDLSSDDDFVETLKRKIFPEPSSLPESSEDGASSTIKLISNFFV
jgi:hypothetical protein